MQIEIKTTASILLLTVGIAITVHLVDLHKSDDELAKSSTVEITTLTTSSQIGTPTVSTTTTL